jgi:hypothetical protein
MVLAHQSWYIESAFGTKGLCNPTRSTTSAIVIGLVRGTSRSNSLVRGSGPVNLAGIWGTGVVPGGPVVPWGS